MHACKLLGSESLPFCSGGLLITDSNKYNFKKMHQASFMKIERVISHSPICLITSLTWTFEIQRSSTKWKRPIIEHQSEKKIRKKSKNTIQKEEKYPKTFYRTCRRIKENITDKEKKKDEGKKIMQEPDGIRRKSNTRECKWRKG